MRTESETSERIADLLGDTMTNVTLVMGSGGVGKTTVAAGVAALAARRGASTLVITVDLALPRRRHGRHGQYSRGPVPGIPGLNAAMLDAAAAWEGSFGLTPMPHGKAPGEQPVLPGDRRQVPVGSAYAAGEEVLRHAQSGKYARIVVDTPRSTEDWRSSPPRSASARSLPDEPSAFSPGPACLADASSIRSPLALRSRSPTPSSVGVSSRMSPNSSST